LESATGDTDIPDVDATPERSADQASDADQAAEPKRVPLRVPLHLYYIRSGGLVLAKLPIVAGHHPQLTASVADDGRRLEFEAQLRGIQGEILDATSQQRILAMRIRRLIEADQREAAEQLGAQWRRILTAEQVNVRLQELQRRIISESGRGGDRTGLTAAAQRRLERLLQVARQQAQQHLTPELEREVLRELRAAGEQPLP
jgi:ribosomal protein S18